MLLIRKANNVHQNTKKQSAIPWRTDGGLLVRNCLTVLFSIAYADEGAYYGSKGLTLEAIKQHQQQTQQEDREIKAMEQSNRLQERQLRHAQIREEQEEDE